MDRVLSEDRTISSDTWLKGVMGLLKRVPQLMQFQRRTLEHHPEMKKQFDATPWPHIHNAVENLLVIQDAKGRWHIAATSRHILAYVGDSMYGVFDTREEAAAVVYIIGSMVADGLLLPLWRD